MAESGGGASQERNYPAGGRSVGDLVVRTTNDVPAPQRVQFWRDDMMRWLEPDETPDERGPFQAELNRIQGRRAELVDLRSDAMTATRDLERCRKDSCDDISFEFMVSGTSDTHNGLAERTVRTGDFSVIDCGKPVEMVRSKHRNISLMVGRAHVRASMRELSQPARHEFPACGLTSLFKSHVLTTMDHARDLKSDQRAMAIDVATDLALAILQAETFGQFDAEQLSLGFYHAAKSIIERNCTNPDLTPRHVARTLGCSRAALYRAFAGSDETIAASIWSSRVEHAHRMLNSAHYAQLSITEIVFQSGFLDHSTFNRMFKRHYDRTAEDMRRAFQQT